MSENKSELYLQIDTTQNSFRNKYLLNITDLDCCACESVSVCECMYRCMVLRTIRTFLGGTIGVACVRFIHINISRQNNQ